jgi:phosphate transport system substrate-binding protein
LPKNQQLNSQIYIQVIHRSDGSGTTAIFTHYLAAVSPAWKSSVGAGGTSVAWLLSER